MKASSTPSQIVTKCLRALNRHQPAQSPYFGCTLRVGLKPPSTSEAVSYLLQSPIPMAFGVLTPSKLWPLDDANIPWFELAVEVLLGFTQRTGVQWIACDGRQDGLGPHFVLCFALPNSRATTLKARRCCEKLESLIVEFAGEGFRLDVFTPLPSPTNRRDRVGAALPFYPAVQHDQQRVVMIAGEIRRSFGELRNGGKPRERSSLYSSQSERLTNVVSLLTPFVSNQDGIVFSWTTGS